MIIYDETTDTAKEINAGDDMRGRRFTHIILDASDFRHLTEHQSSTYLYDILKGFRPIKQESNHDCR